jgi:low temperature requirement protein LtrA
MTQESPAVRVSTLELFFDLVFVFTVTQLADSLAHHLTPSGLLNVVLILIVVWWMYSGYAWLTNAVAPTTTTRRTLLLAGMAGFLVMALAIPGAFGEYGWLFGIAYVVVNISHSVMFLQAGPAAVRVMRTLGPMNLLAALLVLAGGLLPEPWRHLCWLAAPVVQVSASYLHPMELHHISAGHFVERHSLVVLAAVLGLCVAYYLWWAYFADGDRRSEHVLAEAGDPARRARLALNAWGYAHIPILLGIVVTAVGIKKTLGHAFEGLHWGEALTLGGGVAIYLLGHAVFLRLLKLPGASYRIGVAALCLATAPLGHLLAVAQLAAVAAIMAGGAIVEDLERIRRSSLAEAIGDFGRGA